MCFDRSQGVAEFGTVNKGRERLGGGGAEPNENTSTCHGGECVSGVVGHAVI